MSRIANERIWICFTLEEAVDEFLGTDDESIIINQERIQARKLITPHSSITNDILEINKIGIQLASSIDLEQKTQNLNIIWVLIVILT